MIEFTMEHGTFNFLLKHVHAKLDLLKITIGNNEYCQQTNMYM